MRLRHTCGDNGSMGYRDLTGCAACAVTSQEPRSPEQPARCQYRVGWCEKDAGHDGGHETSYRDGEVWTREAAAPAALPDAHGHYGMDGLHSHDVDWVHEPALPSVERLARAIDACWPDLLAPGGGKPDGLLRSAAAILAELERAP